MISLLLLEDGANDVLLEDTCGLNADRWSRDGAGGVDGDSLLDDSADGDEAFSDSQKS